MGVETTMTIPATMTLAEKKELLLQHNKLWRTIMDTPISDRNCTTCDKCVKNDAGVPCCAARKMMPIPFEVLNKSGGCGLFVEQDFIPF